jgi:hypothetical protein
LCIVSSYNLESDPCIGPPHYDDQNLALEYFGCGYFGTKENDTMAGLVCQFDLQVPGVYDALASATQHPVVMAEVNRLLLL